MIRTPLLALLVALAPAAARAGAVSCTCYCGKVLSPPCGDAACKQACGWRDPGASQGGRSYSPAPQHDAEAARREQERQRAEEELRREVEELARKRDADAKRRAKEFEDARDRTAGMLHGASGLDGARGGRPSLKGGSESALVGSPRAVGPGLSLRRAARCALAPLHEALREHGPAAVQLGADVERELDRALRAPRKSLAPGQDDVVTVFRDLKRSSPGGDVQAVADVLVVRSGATGDVHVDVQYSVGRRGRETTGGQSILHFDTAGRLKDADKTDAVHACVAE